MTALRERGVGETKILGQWWCKGLFLGGKACLYQGENDEAVTCLKKGSKVNECPHDVIGQRSTRYLKPSPKRFRVQKASGVL